MKKLILLILPLLLCDCVYDPPRKEDKGIQIRNNNDSAIYVYYSFTDSIQKERKLTLFGIEYYNNIKHIESPYYRINAYTTGTIGNPKSNESRINLFFITEETMRKKTWTEIYKKQLYTKKMRINVSDLAKTNSIIEYKK
jgi:hypothetical protein